MMTNRAAAVLAEAYPGVYVSMLAYHGTDAPPKTVRPLDNVRISYCYDDDTLREGMDRLERFICTL